MFRQHSHPWWKSFVYAFRGLRRVFWRERNFRFDSVVALLVVGGGVICRLAWVEWALLWLAMALVLSLEVANTAIEALCDEVRSQRHPAIRRIKDMMAGAVLLASLGSVGVGVSVFGPHVWHWLSNVIASR